MKNYDDPEGVEAISRGLSEAKPPEHKTEKNPTDPEGLSRFSGFSSRLTPGRNPPIFVAGVADIRIEGPLLRSDGLDEGTFRSHYRTTIILLVCTKFPAFNR